jgi:hypothetical protein
MYYDTNNNIKTYDDINNNEKKYIIDIIKEKLNIFNYELYKYKKIQMIILVQYIVLLKN